MEPLDKKAKSVKACETCKKPFGLHTCKRCNKVICADCYKGRIKIVTYDLKAAHKVCYACEKEHNFQVNFKTSNQTSWNTLSKIGQKWLAACNPKQKLTQQSQEGFEESYKGYLDIVKSPYFSTSNNYFAMIDRDISQGRLDRERTNYSFQEFLYYNQAKVTQEQVRASMANVLKAFIVKFPEIGYCQGMNYVCMFLLCLMDEESAFWTLGYVVANLVPVNFYGQTDFGVPLFGFQQEKFVLSNLIKEHLQLDSDMAQKITTLLDVHGASLLAPLLANFSNFEVLYETWNMMLTNNSINEIRKVIISMMKLFLPKLKQKSMINPVEFQIMVIRLFNSEEFKDAQSIQIDDEHVRFLEAKFKGDHSNWQSHETKIHYTMRRALKFNKDQIRSMKERFDKLLGTRPRRSTSKMNLSMAEDPEGVAREDFRKLLTDVLSNDPESKGFMESLDVDALYDSLDSDNCGVLDFKEFLFLISMMLKGSFEEKLQSAFYVFDSGDKGVLTSNEFDQFLQVLVQTTVQANQDNITPFFNQDLENFNEKMASITNDKEKINFDMIRKELFNSNFIKYSEVIEKLGQQNDGTSKRNTMTKDPNFDTSVLHTNQTYMDSTQDTTHLTHQTHHKADDLTRILDHSQSTILEESKYEEDKPNDDILTEAQKEKILVEEKAPEPVKKEEEKKAGVIEEVEADGTRKSSKVEYTHTASAKSLIEKFNKNKQVASAMPPKKEPTTKLVGKLADSDKKFGGQASFEKLFENSLVSSDSLTSFDDSDHRKQPELSFNFDEDKRAHLHPLANMSKPASIPFGRNFLSPLELSDVDIKPTDMSDFTLSFLNNTSEFSPEHISVNVSLQIAKPFAENAYEPLALDSPAQKPVLDEWKLGFFESTNQPLLPISHLSQSSNTHNKPFHDNTMFALAPEHDFSLPPGLQMWKIDQIEHGDKPVKPVELVRPLQPLKKPISSQGGSETLLSSNILEAPILDTLKGNGFEQVDQGVKPGHVSSLLKVIKKPFAEVGQYNPLPSQNLVDRPTLDISEGKLFGFFNTSDSIKPAAAQNISAAIKKPFHQSHLTPLPQSYPENASKFLEWKEGCFEVTEQRVHEMNHPKSMNHIQNPFSGGAYMAMESEERVFEAPFATNWKQDCFESFEKQPKQAEIVRILAPAKKPFAEGGYQPLARHERFFDAPVLEGWKEDCFGPIERPVQQIKPASPLQAVNKPFNDGFYHALVPEHQVLEKSTLTGWKEDCFSSTRQPAVPVQHLVHVLKPVRKPFSGGESASLPVQEASIGLSLLHGYKEDCFTAHNQPAAPAQLAYTSKVIRKPFSGGESHTLHKETALPDIATLEWKEDCFTSTESPIRPSEKPSLIPIARKPISGGAAQTLPKDNTFSDMITLEWKEDCFLSSESPLEPNEGVSLIKSIGRPFADGACQPLPPHEHSLDDSLLGGWKPDWLQGDTQLVSHTDSTQPLKTKKKPIEEGTVYSNLKQEEGLLDASDLQSWTEELFHSTEKSIAPMDVDQPLSTNRKPFAEGTCQPLSKDDHLFDSISFEEELFSALEAQCQPMELAHHLKRVQKPFEETGYSAIQPQERGNDHPTLIGWTETCFEANDMASAKIGIVQTIKHTKNPFTGGTCETVPVDRRHFDDYELIGGWKEDCFSKEDVQVLPSEPSQTLRPVKKPFADAGCQALETGQGSMVSAPVSWKSDMFLQTDKQHSATAPVNKLQPVTKPIKNAGALVPLVQALPEIEVENTLFSHSDMNIFGAQDKASRPQSRPSEVPRAIQVNKPMFANMARHLEADKGDSEIIFIVDNIDVVDSKVSPVKAQDLARISKNAAKVERYLYGNHAEDQKPEESEIRDSLEARYPYFSQTDKALRPHQWPGYKELIPKVPKEIKFEHIEERKNDESGTTTVIVNSASGSNKSDDFEIVREHGEQLLIEREHSQEEHVVKASEKIVYEDDEEETAGDSMFINKSAIENDTIYTNIGESSAGKRKRNAFDLEADPKTNSSCKVCSLF